MKTKRVEAGYTFTSFTVAKCFEHWLHQYDSDSDYGYPKHVNTSPIDEHGGCTVLYQFDSNNQTARGVATGMEFLDLHEPGRDL